MSDKMREALEVARQFVDPDRDPPHVSNRELVFMIDAALAQATPSRPVTAGSEIDADLLQRCKELLQWGRTGLLNGGSGGAIRALAAKYEAQGIRELYAMSIAESKTKDEAMEALIKIGDCTVTPQDSRADIEELANIYLLGRGMAQSSIDQIREYQGETWLKACDLARAALAPKGAA